MIPTRFGLKLDVVSLLLLTIACLVPTCVAKQDQQPAPQLDSVAYVSGTEGYACYRCPTLAVTQAGTVLAFCEGRVHGHKDEDDMDIVLKRSTDGGRTWGPLQVLANDGKNPCKCQCPVVLPSGRILLVWLWNKWIPSEKDRTTREVYVMHSDDNGDTWHIGGSAARPRTTECTVVELSNGDLMLNSRNQNGQENHRVVSISKDGGQTFTETWLESQLVEPRGCQASLLFHSLDTKTKKANILFSNPANAEYRSDGTLKLSQDDGRTWTNSFRYAKQPAPNFTAYSDIALMPDQSIGILHERGSLEEARKKSDRYDEIGFTVVGLYQIKDSR